MMMERHKLQPRDTDRRRFLARAVLALGGLLSAVSGWIGGVYLIGPRGSTSRGRWTPVMGVGDIQAGQPLNVEYLEVVPDAWATIRRRKSAWLVRTEDGTITAFDPHCTHLGCPYDWDPGERVFNCPCHGGVFDLEGKVIAGPPPRPLDTLEVRIEEGRLFLGSVLRSSPVGQA